jgi:hypothetical protein
MISFSLKAAFELGFSPKMANSRFLALFRCSPFADAI